jgi:hypothetical protein
MAVGSITNECFGCNEQNSAPNYSGYNRYFANNPCNNKAPQWLVLNDAITNHGYWSFASSSNNTAYTYSVEAFANNYTMQGTNGDTWRTLFYNSPYGFNPSPSNITWNNYIDSVSAINDLMQYSLNTGDCYSGQGVPGGIYSGFGQFAMKKSDDGGALPVKIMYVNAAPAAQNIVVTWATALEINNNGFDVEKSVDGVNFTKIGWVNGHDNSTTQQNYSFTDVNVQPNVVYYYRLNQVNNNGDGTLSNLAWAEVTGTNADVTFSISEPMPNPASVSSKFEITSSISQPLSVKLFNMMGQMVCEQPYNLNAGDNTVNLNVQPLANGTYSAVIEAGGKSFSKMIVVTR